MKAWRAPPAGRTGVRAGLLPRLEKGYVRRNVDPEVDAAGQEARATCRCFHYAGISEILVGAGPRARPPRMAEDAPLRYVSERVKRCI